jgi:membrane-bound serine protease (ClpP class)
MLAVFGLLLALQLPGSGPDGADRARVLGVHLDGLVENGLARYVERAIRRAEQEGFDAVLLEVDTFGGLLDAADYIRKVLLETPLRTIAYVNPNAASAGALICYACTDIVMAPGSSMGAATVVEGGSGERAPDKYQSYMRALMRATAEARGRDPRIAEAMVDERVVVPGLDDSTTVLTLSAEEALRLGVARAIANTPEEALAAVGMAGAELVDHRASWAERVLRFLSHPVVTSLLLLMMLGGLYFELQTPGVGFPGLMALIGAALFFAPHYLLGLVEAWEVVLFVVGLLLLLVELLLLPGFGVAGVLGIGLMLVSLLAALVGNVGLDFPGAGELARATMTLAITLVLFLVLIFSVGRYMPRAPLFRRLVLEETESAGAGYTAGADQSNWIGQRGRALTPLRPGGSVEIGGRRLDALSEGEYIPAGAEVEVIDVRGAQLVVRMLT